MSRSLRPVVIVGVVALLVIAGVAIWLVFRDGAPNGDGGPGGKVGPLADARAVVERKNVALGLLENNQPAEAVPVFEEITEQVPDDPLGPQNLAVASLLSAKEIDRTRESERHAAALERTEAALRALRERGSGGAVVHVLAARVAVEQNREADAIERLRRAASQEPDEAWIWFELSQIALQSEDPQLREMGREALEAALERQPNNLFVLVNWIRLVASHIRQHSDELRMAGNDDPDALDGRVRMTFPDLVQRLEAARHTIEPFVHTIKETTRQDPLSLLETAIASAKDSEWVAASTRMSMLANILAPQMQVDESRVSLHPLEFVALDFQPGFYELNEVEESDGGEPIEVDFAPAPANQWIHEDLQEQLAGAAHVELADFDLDGKLDVVVLSEDAVRVFGRGEEDWSILAEVAVASGMRGLLVADLDLDFDETEAAAGGRPDPEAVRNGTAAPCLSADVDLIAYGAAGAQVFVNTFDAASGRRSLQAAGETGLNDVGEIRTAALLDLDSDGDLDLVLATDEGSSIWSNRGNLSFLEISDRSQLPPADLGAQALLPVDWDRDVDIDLVVAGHGGVGVLENLRHGRLRWRSLVEEFEAPAAAAAVALVDADANASWDLLVGGPEGISLIQTRTPESGVVRHASTTRISDEPAEALEAWDYDNDGVLDILAWTGDAVRVLRGVGGGKFEPVDDLIASPPQSVRSVAIGDLDGDGDLDLVVAGAEELIWLQNDGGNRNRWIRIALQAQQVKGADPTASGRVNAHGLGSLIEVKANARYLPRVVTGQTTHIGLGPVEKPDVIRVLWTNGIPRNVIQPEADQVICEQQVLEGSCPYLYTWDGEKFTFVTDLLWAAPIGLQFAEGVLAPAREWEYLKVPGGMLAPRDGEYVLQITEELWEAGYFDEVKLIAVDHPADVEIFSNEKVGPAEIAEFKVHTVRQRRAPAAARDHRGRDVLPELASQDNIYLKAFDRKLRQGLVEDHYIELDLGDLRDPRQMTLFLTGWLYPTDTAINVALSQNPDLPSPRPPSLWVPDANGQWKEVRPYMGFPGGKTKTIAVDISDLFPRNDYRVRIATNMEFYWDAAFFTVDEPPAEFRLTQLDLLGSELHYRGFSRHEHQWDNAPDRYLYNNLSTAPQWPPIAGRFTRFGDVTELAAESDDRLVVMGPGDEMTLRFAVPDEPLPEGWTRDFLLYNVGWDKDFNLNTVLGQTVEPLPFRGMSGYPWPPDEATPDSPEYQEYLRTYQTRELDQRFWRVIRENSSGNPAGQSP